MNGVKICEGALGLVERVGIVCLGSVGCVMCEGEVEGPQCMFVW